MNENQTNIPLPLKTLILLLIPWLTGVFIKMEPGLFVSLVLVIEIIFIRLEAIKLSQLISAREAQIFYILVCGVCLGLYLQDAGIHYYLGLGLGAVAGSLVHKRYRLPLYIFVQTMVFMRGVPPDISKALDILLYSLYGIIMIAAALGLMERRRQNE